MTSVCPAIYGRQMEASAVLALPIAELSYVPTAVAFSITPLWGENHII